MARLTRLGLCMGATVLVLAAAPSASLAAAKVLTFTATGVRLADEDGVTLQSTNVAFETSAGTATCETSTLSGKLTVNLWTKDKASFTSGVCRNGETEIVADGDLPWNVEFTRAGAAALKGTNRVQVRSILGGVECLFESSKVNATFAPGPSEKSAPVVLKVSSQRFKRSAKSSTKCPVEGRLNATYAMYYEGNESIPVGAEAGPPLTATWRISGSFLGGGSSKPIESQSPAFKVQFTERTIGRIQLECSIRNTGELAEQVLPPKEEGKETPPPGEAKLVFEVAGNCVEIEPVRGRRWAPFKFGAPFRPFCGYGTNTPPQTGETTPCPEDIARPPQLTPEQSLALGGETVAIQAPPGMLGDAPLEIDAEPLEEGSGTACVISGEIEADFNNADSTLELPETPGPLTKLTGSDCEEPVVSGDDTITLDEGGTLQLLAP